MDRRRRAERRTGSNRGSVTQPVLKAAIKEPSTSNAPTREENHTVHTVHTVHHVHHVHHVRPPPHEQACKVRAAYKGSL